MTTRLGGVLKRAALLAGSILFTLVVGEALARLRPVFRPHPRVFPGEWADRRSPNFVKDADTGWRMRPDHAFGEEIEAGIVATYRSNRQGFRGETDFDTAWGRPIIAVLGDSFTYGAGVQADSIFSALIEHELPRSAVYNFAMPGFGLDQIWMSLRHQAAAYHPRLVIVGFIDDDLSRSQSAFRHYAGFNKPLFVLDADTLRPAREGDQPSVPVRVLERYSWLFRAGQLAVEAAGRNWPVGDWWRVNAAIVRAIVADAHRLGAEVLLVRLPETKPVPFRTFAALASDLDVGYIDLAGPGLRRPPAIFFEHDMHINAAGHRWVADAVLQWLRAHEAALADQSSGI